MRTAESLDAAHAGILDADDLSEKSDLVLGAFELAGKAHSLDGRVYGLGAGVDDGGMGK